MKKRIWIVIFILASLFFLPKLYWAIKALPYREKQERLAITLGVDINRYRRVDFPSDYFFQELKPGMSVYEIHQIIKGYDQVLRCDDYAEVYFYFNPPDTEPFKYMILYNEKLFKSFITEDLSGDRRIALDGCTAGVLPE